MADGTHDAILDSEDKTLLLIRRGADTDRSEKLPDIDVIARIDAAWENVRQARFNNVEEGVESRLPGCLLVKGLQIKMV